jgi:hypothetical protein
MKCSKFLIPLAIDSEPTINECIFSLLFFWHCGLFELFSKIKKKNLAVIGREARPRNIAG